ncbi:MAG: NAD-dependent epimerase/dehydratase family protein [Chloroflexi bacterium]|nr:NAD-dependent epimerase/dehydratase family protein [Chloroflexota bacterium]
MRILILGGTRFVGRYITEAALTRGHQVTLFNRGQTNSDLFPAAAKVRGDRSSGDYGALQERIAAGARWDAVVDVNGYVPRIVRETAQTLVSAASHYTFISTISVYAQPLARGLDENAPLATLADESVEDITGETYGGLKVLCERAVQALFPARTLIIRPGLIVGPQDPTDRFTYWPARAAKGGDMLAPGGGDDPLQCIDARDLAAFTLLMVEKGAAGVYNATGPATTLTMRTLLETCQRAAANDLRLTWVDEVFLQAHDVQMWTHLPLWLPASSESGALHTASIARALAAGLTFRPLIETVRDTMEWDKTRPADAARNANFGLPPEREAEVLRLWHARP